LVQSVKRALSILETLAQNRADLGVSDLGRALGLSKSTVHRLLATLEEGGYVQSSSPGRYALGIKAFEVGSAVLNRMGLRKVALGPMQELADLTKETVNLALLDGLEIVYIDRIECSEPLRMDLQVGRRVPTHCSALGKAILAFLDPQESRDIMRRLSFSRYTARTIIDSEALRRELPVIREQGYSVDDEEYIEGIRCVAAPLFDYHSRPVAALSVAGPSVRLTPGRIESVAQVLVTATRSISRGLGFRDANLNTPGMAGSR
jgi:DNA-binding IclR family transcriptional regulator